MEPKTFQRIREDITNHSIVLYMKGTKEEPQCGFSMVVVNILQSLNVPFHDINVLEDAELRQDIKAFSKWPTIPQVYINGDFIGGCDILKELYQNGDLASLVAPL